MSDDDYIYAMNMSDDDKPDLSIESTVDPDDPPTHVREAAADLGVSVNFFRENYLSKPDACQIASDLHETCVTELYSKKFELCTKDPPDCTLSKFMWGKYQCDKFEKKYSRTMREGLWYSYILPFLERLQSKHSG